MKKTAYKISLKNVMICCIVTLFSLPSFAKQKQSISEVKENYILFITSANFEQNFSKSLYWYVNNYYKHTGAFIAAESLLVPSIDDVDQAMDIVNALADKYVTQLPEAIIMVGDPGWMLCRHLFDTVWNEVPVVIMESHDRLPADLETLLSKTPMTSENSVPSEEWTDGYNVTVFKQKVFIKETIGLMKQITPEMEKLALVSDNRYISSVVREKTTNVIKNDFPELELINLFNMTTNQMLDSLINLDKNTGVIYYSWIEEIALHDSLSLINHIQEVIGGLSSTPLFTLMEPVSVNSFAGGHYISIDELGSQLVEVLDEILAGTPAREIYSAAKGIGKSYLNYPYLMNYGIPVSYLPKKNIEYINPPVSFFKEYKDEIIILCVSLLFIFLLISFYIRSLRQKEQQREKENQILKQKEHVRIFYESVLDNLPVGVTIKNINDNFKYTFWNKRTVELFDQEQDMAIGSNFDSLHNRAYAEEIEPMDREIVKDKVSKSMVKEYAMNGVKRFYQVSKNIIPYSDEDDLRIVSTVTDVSDIIFNKENLELLNKKYEIGMKAAGFTTWLIDLVAGKLLFNNRCFDIRDIEKIVHPDDYEGVIKSFNNILTGECDEIHLEYRYKTSPDTPDNEYKWVMTSCIVEKYDEHGKPVSVICASVDINKRKLLELDLLLAKEEAEKANRMKSAFLANMSHEIRTPLNAIVGFSEVISETEDPEERREFQKIISNNNELLLQLINDILDISKMESGKMDFVYGDVSINDVIDEVSRSAAFQKLSDKVELRVDKPLPDCIVTTDRNRIMQVFNNFVSNAVKFTDEGEILIGYSIQDNNKVYCYVRDTGRGISPDELSKIFDRFVKLDVFTQGTGLGLSISKKIVEELGGSIGVKSEKGKGSEFWFTLTLPEQEKS